MTYSVNYSFIFLKESICFIISSQYRRIWFIFLYAFASLNKSIQIVGYTWARNNKGIQSIQSIIVKSSLFLFQIINCQAMDDYIGSSQFLALQQISQFQLFNLDLVICYSISIILAIQSGSGYCLFNLVCFNIQSQFIHSLWANQFIIY